VLGERGKSKLFAKICWSFPRDGPYYFLGQAITATNSDKSAAHFPGAVFDGQKRPIPIYLLLLSFLDSLEALDKVDSSCFLSSDVRSAIYQCLARCLTTRPDIKEFA